MKKVKPAEKFVSKEKPGASVSVNSVTILVQYSEEISNWEKSVMLFEIGKLRKVGKDLMIRVGVESVTGLSDGAGVVDYLVNNALLGGVTDDERNVLLYRMVLQKLPKFLFYSKTRFCPPKYEIIEKAPCI